EAPIRILVEIIAYLSKGTLKRLYENRETHNIVKRHIINTFKDKQSKKKVEKSKKSD
ncbi:MAG: hypothetical protein GY757_08485, partial [bacterium]|nr:hypothetical protein [bacterium]